MNKISFICCSNNEDTLNKYLLASNIFKNIYYQLIIKRGHTNICKTYNEAMEEATGDILCFVHHDVFMPPAFESDLQKSLDGISHIDWGVLGVAGVIKGANGQVSRRGFMDSKGFLWGNQSELPIEIQTVDELLLIIKKDSFKFDENITNQHLFGAELCCQAAKAGKKNLVINAFCVHNFQTWDGTYTPEYYESRNYVRNKWKEYLPIYVTTGIIE